LRKQQIVELGLLRDDEKARLTRSFEKELDAVKQMHETEIKCLKQKLKDQREELENEIRVLIKQSDDRSRKLNDRVQEMEHTIKILDCENRKLRDCLEREKNDLLAKLDEEKQSTKKHFQNRINVNFSILIVFFLKKCFKLVLFF
jgi:centrosomal protein CEP112